MEGKVYSEGFLLRRVVRDEQGRRGRGDWLRYHGQIKGELFAVVFAGGTDDDPVALERLWLTATPETVKTREVQIEDRSYERGSQGQYQPILRLSYGRGVEQIDYLAPNHTALREWLAALHRSAREAMLLDCHWTLETLLGGHGLGGHGLGGQRLGGYNVGEHRLPNSNSMRGAESSGLLLQWPGTQQWTQAYARVETSKRALRTTPARPLALYLYTDAACKRILAKLRHPSAAYALRTQPGCLVLEAEATLKLKKQWAMVPRQCSQVQLQVPPPELARWVAALRTIFQLTSPKALLTTGRPAELAESASTISSSGGNTTLSGRPWTVPSLRRTKSARSHSVAPSPETRIPQIPPVPPMPIPHIPQMPMPQMVYPHGLYPHPFYQFYYPTMQPPAPLSKSRSTTSLHKLSRNES